MIDSFQRDARTAELQVSLHNTHKNNKKNCTSCKEKFVLFQNQTINSENVDYVNNGKTYFQYD